MHDITKRQLKMQSARLGVTLYHKGNVSNLFRLCGCIYFKLEEYISNNNQELIKQYSVYYNALFDILALFDEFKNEYRGLLKTNRIIEYVFKHEKLSPELKRYVQNVWKSFSNLLKFKLSMFENNNLSYDEVYSKFRDELKHYREYFYGKIYAQTHEFDSEIKQIQSILF